MPRSIREIAVILILSAADSHHFFRSEGSRKRFRNSYSVHCGQAISTGCCHHSRPTGSHVAKLLNLVNIKEENKALKNEVRRLVAERTRLLNAENENRRLKKLLNLKAQYEFPSLIA